MNLYRIHPANYRDLYPTGWVSCKERIVWAKDPLHAERLVRCYDTDSVCGWRKIPLVVKQINLTEKECILCSSYVDMG